MGYAHTGRKTFAGSSTNDNNLNELTTKFLDEEGVFLQMKGHVL